MQMQLRTFTASKQKGHFVTLNLQLDLFIIYSWNDNATYICAQLSHLHFNQICVTKKTERELLYIGTIIEFIRTGNDPWLGHWNNLADPQTSWEHSW